MQQSGGRLRESPDRMADSVFVQLQALSERIVNIRLSLLALSALDAAAPPRSAQIPAVPIRTPYAAAAAYRAARGMRRRPAVAEPWQARPGRCRSGSAAPQRSAQGSAALEPIDLPPAIEQGVDMIYIDQELVPRAVHDERHAPRHVVRRLERRAGRHVRRRSTRSTPSFAAGWSSIASAGATCRRSRFPPGRRSKPASTGERVAALRERLGLAPRRQLRRRAGRARSRSSRRPTASRTTASPAPGRSTALNRGAHYYEQLIIINMERAKRLPCARGAAQICRRRRRRARGCRCGRTGARSTA